MRQLPLAVLALLVPANAVSAVHYHTKTTTYACVDPRALNSRNPIVRAEGRCFKVLPRETWERIWRSPSAVVLLRIKPPHPGEPPLYFKRSNLILVHPHRRLVRHHRRSEGATDLAPPSSRDAIPNGSALSPSVSAAVPSRGAREAAGATALAGGPVATSPLAPPNAISPGSQNPTAADQSASDQARTSAVASPDRSAPNSTSKPAAATQAAGTASAPDQTLIQTGQTPASKTPAAPAGGTAQHAKTRSHHLIWPLLLWAVMIAFAGLLVQLVLRRRPASSEADTVARRESATVPRSSIWEPVHPDLPDIVEKLDSAPVVGVHAPLEPAPHGDGMGGETGETMVPVPAPPASISEPISLSDYKNGCVARLRHAGWDARTRFTGGQRGPDVIARHNGLVLALQCHPSASPVDVEAVEDACLVRERQRSDLAAIVSNATYTEAARQLAARTGIVLLHEDQLASFAA